jgi:hypothetical protein
MMYSSHVLRICLLAVALIANAYGSYFPSLRYPPPPVIDLEIQMKRPLTDVMYFVVIYSPVFKEKHTK